MQLLQKLTFLEFSCCSEINNLKSVILFSINKNIFRLEISMDNTLVMAIGDSLQNLFDNTCSHGLRELSLLNDFIEQLTTLA